MPFVRAARTWGSVAPVFPSMLVVDRSAACSSAVSPGLREIACSGDPGVVSAQCAAVSEESGCRVPPATARVPAQRARCTSASSAPARRASLRPRSCSTRPGARSRSISSTVCRPVRPRARWCRTRSSAHQGRRQAVREDRGATGVSLLRQRHVWRGRHPGGGVGAL